METDQSRPRHSRTEGSEVKHDRIMHPHPRFFNTETISQSPIDLRTSHIFMDMQATAGVRSSSPSSRAAAPGAGKAPSGIPISRSRILGTSPRMKEGSFTAESSSSRNATAVKSSGQSSISRESSSPKWQDLVQRSHAIPRSASTQQPFHPALHDRLSAPRSVTRSVSDRSIDRQSIDSVQLAIKLDRATMEGFEDGFADGEVGRFIEDEVAPFVTVAEETKSEEQEKQEEVSSERFTGEKTENTRNFLVNDSINTTPTDPPIRETAPKRTRRGSPSPSLQTIPKSSSMTIAPRMKTSTATPARQRTISALKASHSPPPRSSSGSSLAATSQRKKSPSMNSLNSSLTRSHGSGSFASSSSKREHYPAEVYMVPRIAEYTVAEAGWDDTVIPTVARKMYGEGGVEMDDGDQLVAEWTPDGKPVRVERLSARATRVSGERQDVVDGALTEHVELVSHSAFYVSSLDLSQSTLNSHRQR